MPTYLATAAPPTTPYLVSFPRTGSHWLRMFLEMYFDRPLLTRSFFRHDNDDFLLLHVHDNQQPVPDRRDTLYLHRGVVSTLFSELTYRHGPAAPDLPWGVVEACSREYERDLMKWLVGGDFALRKHVVAYEWMLDRPMDVLPGVIEFLGGDPDTARIADLWPRVTHESVAEAAGDNPKVVDQHGSKELRKELFRYRFGSKISAMFRANKPLAQAIDPVLLD